MSNLLIINADDFGLTDGVSRGIVECAEGGGITSTTAMMCAPEFVKNVEKHLPALSVPCGVHLQVTTGRPISAPMKKYCTSMGNKFPRSPNDVKFPPELVGIEWAAQIEFFRKNFGEPSHLDTHHGLQNRSDYSDVFLQLASREGLPARGNDVAFFEQAKKIGVPVTYLVTGHKSEWTGTLGDAEVALGSVKDILQNAPEGVTLELIVHPGLNDADLQAISTFTDCRPSELEVLNGKEFASGIEALGIQLISFTQLSLINLQKNR